MGDRKLFGIIKIKDGEPSDMERRVYQLGRNIMIGWHILEGRSRDIIDFDLNAKGRKESFMSVATAMKVSGPSIADRAQVVEVLKRLAADFKAIPTDKIANQHNFDLAQAQIKASTAFARRLRGERLDPIRYMEDASGLEMSEEVVPEETLETQTKTVLTFAQAMGIPELDERSLDGFRNDRQLNDVESKTALEAAVKKSTAQLEKFLGQDFDYPAPIKQEVKDAPYSAWAYTDPTTAEFSIRENLFGRIWTPGRAEEMGSHEGTHVNRMGKRKDQIRTGNLDRFFGLTTVHGPESAVEEGLAQTITFFIPGAFESLSPEGQFQVQSYILKQMVLSNVSIMLNCGEGADAKTVSEYIYRFLPWESQAEIDRQIIWRTDHKLNQIYLPQYGFGAAHFMRYAANLNDAGKKEFLRQLFSKPYTLKQTDEDRK